MSEFEEGAKAVAATMNAGEKLVDVLEKATCGLLKPRQMIRKAKATAKVMDIIADAAKKHPEIAFKYEDEEIMISNELQSLSFRAANRLALTEVIKQVNIESVVSQSYDELKNEDIDKNNEVDRDWVLRFFSSIENVSDENMQKVWSKILSGKIRTPKKYSLRTIDILSNLSKEDCEFIQFVSQFVVESGNSCFIYNNQKLLEKYNINFDKLLYLQELNIIHSSNFTNITRITDNKISVIFKHCNHVLLCNKEGEHVQIPVYTFTKSGIEILGLVPAIKDVDFSLDMFKCICEKNVQLSCHKIISENGEEIQYTLKSVFDNGNI